jgi:hypothetical protein
MAHDKEYKRYVSPLGGSYEVGPEGREQTRIHRFVVLVTFDEMAEMKAAAHRAMMTASTWGRKYLLAGLKTSTQQQEELREAKRNAGIRDEEEPAAPVMAMDVDGPIGGRLPNPAQRRRRPASVEAANQTNGPQRPLPVDVLDADARLGEGGSLFADFLDADEGEE